MYNDYSRLEEIYDAKTSVILIESCINNGWINYDYLMEAKTMRPERMAQYTEELMNKIEDLSSSVIAFNGEVGRIDEEWNNPGVRADVQKKVIKLVSSAIFCISLVLDGMKMSDDFSEDFDIKAVIKKYIARVATVFVATKLISHILCKIVEKTYQYSDKNGKEPTMDDIKYIKNTIAIGNRLLDSIDKAARELNRKYPESKEGTNGTVFFTKQMLQNDIKKMEKTVEKLEKKIRENKKKAREELHS